MNKIKRNGISQHTRFRVIRGVSDTIGVTVCAFLIIIMLALMGSFFSWLRSDLTTTFSSVAQSVYEAIFVAD